VWGGRVTVVITNSRHKCAGEVPGTLRGRQPAGAAGIGHAAAGSPVAGSRTCTAAAAARGATEQQQQQQLRQCTRKSICVKSVRATSSSMLCHQPITKCLQMNFQHCHNLRYAATGTEQHTSTHLHQSGRTGCARCGSCRCRQQSGSCRQTGSCGATQMPPQRPAAGGSSRQQRQFLWHLW
jgi:hypothetical protein